MRVQFSKVITSYRNYIRNRVLTIENAATGGIGADEKSRLLSASANYPITHSCIIRYEFRLDNLIPLFINTYEMCTKL